ncbi:MAG: hypothetical protein C0408_05805 [Odoribacter sp.]|nr:hypothetical protein [Odoribacter sp.]
MKSLYIEKTAITPEINFSPDENIFIIKGSSSPEDVRALYYPVIEWIRLFADDIIEGVYRKFSSDNPLKMQIDLDYFNSSSAKFFFDIFTELKRLSSVNMPVIVEWMYDEEDIDQKEAGADIASLVEMEFIFISKKK